MPTALRWLPHQDDAPVTLSRIMMANWHGCESVLDRQLIRHCRIVPCKSVSIFQQNLTVLNGSPCRYGCFKLFKTSVLPIRMKPIRCSSLQLVAVRIGFNQFFALRIALRIASQRNGLVRIGRVWRWARNQKELTRTYSTQHGTDTVVVACRVESLLFTTWRYDAVQFTSRTTKDSYGLQRYTTMEWDEIRIR